MRASPDLVIVGQVTVDDVVPPHPAAWQRQLGGSSLYALAGARLWLEPHRIGLVTRTGSDFPFALVPLLEEAGVRHHAIAPFNDEHLVEWLIYEEDGRRRSLPRNAALRDIGAEGGVTGPAYREKLLQIAPEAREIPDAWLPCGAVHLCPQVGDRHRDSLSLLKNRVPWISVDPSPHYSRHLDVAGLVAHLHGATAFLPSEQEVRHLLEHREPLGLANTLRQAGIPEVLIKRGAQPAAMATVAGSAMIPSVPVSVVDPTGAGDAFCGAYAACRLLGHAPLEAAHHAMATAARIVGCRGVVPALQLERVTG